MRISDWSSDVCSSDLSEAAAHATAAEFLRMLDRHPLSATAAELVQAQAALPPVPITNLRWAPIAPPEVHKAAEPVDLIAGWTRHDAFPLDRKSTRVNSSH